MPRESKRDERRTPKEREQGRFADRVALVTGAGSGIGRATSQRLGREGGRLACVDIDLSSARETARLIEAADGSATAYACDVTDEAQVERMFAAVELDFGPIAVVVANAGIAGPVATIPEIDLADWDRVLAVNLTGVFLCAKHGIPALRRNGGGAMVITASNASFAAEPKWGAYAATKGGVLMLTKALAIDHGPEAIRVNCVCPGPVDTPLLRRGYADELGDAIVSDMSLALPVSAGRPENVAAAIAFLASGEAEMINATALLVDNGSAGRMGSGFSQSLSD